MNKPTQDEKDAAIEYILSKALPEPPTMRAYITELYRTLGLRFIFWDTAGALSLTVIMIALTLVIQPLIPLWYRHAAVFGFSPFLFIFVLFFAETMEYSDKLYELKMTCKHTVRQVTVFRILCFSVIGTVLGVWLTAYHTESMNEFLRLLPLSFASHFLCAFIFLFLIRHFFGKWVYAVSALLWLAAAFAPIIVFGEKWDLFLAGLPLAVTIGFAIGAMGLCLFEIKKLMYKSHKEAAYAIG